jgi:hypothetical protein
MSFRDPNQQQHMMSGIAKAASSPKTPKHLIPHLRNRMNPNFNRSGSKAPQKPSKVLTPSAKNAQQEISQAASPFGSPTSAANQPVPAVQTKGLGNSGSAKGKMRKSSFYGNGSY